MRTKTSGAWRSAFSTPRWSRGEISYGGSFGLSVRVKCSLRPPPISVAWLYSGAGKGWKSTRDFLFGAAVLDEEDFSDELRTVLGPWTADFAADTFVEDVSSKGVKACAVRHEAAVRHQDDLVERLRNVIGVLRSF